MFIHEMRKAQHGVTKRQGGISLVPALWDEIDRIAKAAGVSRNQVMENALMEAFLPSGDLQKTVEHSLKAKDSDTVELDE